MIAVDTNILVYAHRRELPLHPEALARLTALAESSDPWAVPIFCLGEFVRVVTHPGVFDPPTRLEEALEALGGLLESPTVRLLCPGERFWTHLDASCREGNTRGNLVFDAQIAALLKESGVKEILTEDRDFKRFSWLEVVSLKDLPAG